ncbi:MAG TPA: aldolase [Acidobacteriaceae bacterium]|nr:aldolase [Acidobacteriaceae bacterium]
MAARESWGSMARCHDAPKLRLTLTVTDSESLACPPGVVARAQGHLISFVADAQNHVVCDLKQGFAFGCVSRAAVHHRAYLRYHILEAAALIMICTGRATCLHAAAVSWHGHGMLLCGDSGAGKSTLSYACARSGWTYTSDDTSFLLWGLFRPSVMGNSRQVRFRPSAREIFPEIAGRSLTPRAEGKPSIEIPTAELPGILTSDTAAIQSILLLKRQAAARPTLTELSYAAAREYFLRRLYPTPEIRAIHLPILEVLSAATVYEFRYDDLSLAIDCLKRMVESTQSSTVVRDQGHLYP